MILVLRRLKRINFVGKQLSIPFLPPLLNNVQLLKTPLSSRPVWHDPKKLTPDKGLFFCWTKSAPGGVNSFLQELTTI